jgi:hypothetical protein
VCTLHMPKSYVSALVLLPTSTSIIFSLIAALNSRFHFVGGVFPPSSRRIQQFLFSCGVLGL